MKWLTFDVIALAHFHVDKNKSFIDKLTNTTKANLYEAKHHGLHDLEGLNNLFDVFKDEVQSILEEIEPDDQHWGIKGKIQGSKNFISEEPIKTMQEFRKRMNCLMVVIKSSSSVITKGECGYE